MSFLEFQAKFGHDPLIIRKMIILLRSAFTARKHGPEKTPYLNTFHAVIIGKRYYEKYEFSSSLDSLRSY